MIKRKLISLTQQLPDLQLIGINTELADYRLAYFINKDISIKLERLENLPVFCEKSKNIKHYPFFEFHDPDRRVNFYLIGNNHQSGKMIDQYAQADYFLLIKGKLSEETNKAILSSLRQITSVTFVFISVLNKIKELDGILQDLELHLLSLNLKHITEKQISNRLNILKTASSNSIQTDIEKKVTS